MVDDFVDCHAVQGCLSSQQGEAPWQEAGRGWRVPCAVTLLCAGPIAYIGFFF